MRGEHAAAAMATEIFAGSSPRARGTPLSKSPNRHPYRFIPACAGNTTKDSFVFPQNTVHPRVRGEHQAKARAAEGIDGSSPRARGTRLKRGVMPHSHRFIPACAGNTSTKPRRAVLFSVHPRVRGEHEIKYLRRDVDYGSSPRARGTRNMPLPSSDVKRFIPACAGNTYSCQPCRRGMPVHPRVRGEHYPCQLPSLQLRGSSPRARGTPDIAIWLFEQVRFIPACAGNT